MIKENEAQINEDSTFREDTIDVADCIDHTHKLTRRVKEFLMLRTSVDRDLYHGFPRAVRHRPVPWRSAGHGRIEEHGNPCCYVLTNLHGYHGCYSKCSDIF